MNATTAGVSLCLDNILSHREICMVIGKWCCFRSILKNSRNRRFFSRLSWGVENLNKLTPREKTPLLKLAETLAQRSVDLKAKAPMENALLEEGRKMTVRQVSAP